MKRICLFAGYNAKNYVEEHVYDYLRELSKYSEIYYMADGEPVQKEDIKRLLKYCKNVYFVRHQRYDFGSYSLLAKKFVGWDKIEKYDELIFANDSCFCMQSFEPVFKKMAKKECDAWGLLGTDERNYEHFYTLEDYLKIPASKVPYFCIGSYFLAFRKNVITNREFQNFINSVKKQPSRHQVCMKYEMGLTKFLQKKEFKISSFIDIVYRNVIVYNEQGIRLLKQKFPLVKVKIFRDNPLAIINLDKLTKMIATYSKNNKIYEYIKIFDIKENNSKNLKNKIYENLIPQLFKNPKKEVLKQILPPISIEIYKKIKYKNSKQSKLIDIKNHELKEPSGDFVIYFNVAVDTIGGGMLSINRFIDRSIEIFKNADKKILLSGLPLNNPTVSYSMFESQLSMYHFDEIVASIYPEKLILNIPEYYLPGFIHGLKENHKKWLLSIPFLHINIMDQNHDYFPSRAYFEHCKFYTDKVTITTAHKEYTTQDIADEVDCPIKLLMPFLPQFYRQPHNKKEKIIAISPDEFIFDGVAKKNEALSLLKEKLPDYKIQIINNLTLEEYKQLISKAMFTITFGEGYDGYFIEPFLSDSVAFAVYNTTFFPSQFKDAPTVYESYNEFLSKIIEDIRLLEKNANIYEKYSNKTEQMIKEITNDDISLKNLKDFYDDKYDFIPDVCMRTGYYIKIEEVK
ncbi:hypothetical protein N5U55_07755 [Aliarcobacter butzleri]|uniref:rhamnan synthesis F family protein n=1 Tax=Aliarcobacter butzleri TaxID=28197 RepID=UPI0021B320C4|nr:rhamnan synthesis F family protein [Aliarcobacter butzleri]MCT7584004.1 hypothetical protein [Aliarcobacter butzleri]